MNVLSAAKRTSQTGKPAPETKTGKTSQSAADSPVWRSLTLGAQAKRAADAPADPAHRREIDSGVPLGLHSRSRTPIGVSGTVFPSTPLRPTAPRAPALSSTTLGLGAVDDLVESKADRIAQDIVRTPTPGAVAVADSGDGSPLRDATPVSAEAAPPIVREVLTSPGQPLDRSQRGFFEPRFCRDFADTRVHTDLRASESALAVSARAYTVGAHIVFGAGEYAPATSVGMELLAHELAHVASGDAVGVVRRQADDAEAQRVITMRDNFYAAITSGAWGEAAEILNGFNDTDIRSMLAHLTSDQLEKLRNGALERMPGWSDRVVIPVEQIAKQRQERDRIAALERDYRIAVDGADWPRAALILNGFNDSDIARKVKALSLTQQQAIRDAAPPWATRVIGSIETIAGARNPPSSDDPSATAVRKPVSEMTSFEKLSLAIEYAREGRDEAMRRQLDALTSRQAIAAMVFFAGLYIAAQLTPAGWIADAIALTTITLSIFFVGSLLWDIVKHLAGFLAAINATTEPELKIAGTHLADAVAEGGIALVLALLTRGAGKAVKGIGPYEGPPPSGYADAYADGVGIIRVPAQAVPKTVPMVEQSTLVGLASKAVAVQPPTGSGGGQEPPGPTDAENGPYKDIKDNTKVEPNREFQSQQKPKIRAANKARNGGVLKSDDPLDPYQTLGDPEKSVSPGMGGSTQNPAMAVIDHIVPRSKGGTNAYGNARVISQSYNNQLRTKEAK